MKYLVMECHYSYAVVLDENGCFRKAANLHYQVGQTVTQIVELQAPQTQAQPAQKHRSRRLSGLAALAACLILVMTSVFQLNQMPFASVYLTINPEVRIDVNRRDTVVAVEGMNADGEALLEGYSHKKKSLDQVTDELVDRAIELGYLHSGGQVTLTLDADDAQWVADTGSALGAHLNEYLTERISVTIEIEDAHSQRHEVTIPVNPTYAESDYGETTPAPTPAKPAPEAAGSPYDDGQTDYGTVSEDSQSDYGGTEDDGPSNYEVPDADDGMSNYEAPDADDGMSNYDDGGSGYAGDDSDD